MLRNIAGIMADEEPKTPVTASGDANMAYFGNSGDVTLSEGFLAGKSTWSLSFWATPITTLGTKTIYEEDIDGDLAYIELSITNMRVSIPTSASTTTLVEYDFPSNLSEGEIQFYTITADGANDEIKIFVNGLEGSVATMTYANKSGTSTAIFKGGNNYSLSSFASYSTRLTPTEILEGLYIYDDDLLFAGALGFDAYVGGDQIKDTLTHFFSFTEGISYSGNEFQDKVGGSITLGNTSGIEFNTPEIYVYTDASDLPSGLPTEFPVTSGGFTATNYLTVANAPELVLTADFTLAVDMQFDTLGQYAYVFTRYASTGNKRSFIVGKNNDDTLLFNFSRNGLSGGTNSFTYLTNFVVTDNSPVHFAVAFDSIAEEVKLYVNGLLDSTHTNTGAFFPYDSSSPIKFGNFNGGNVYNLLGSCAFPYIYPARALSDSDVLELQDAGTTTCFDDLSSNLLSGLEYAPPFGNWNGSTGNELVDPVNGIVTTNTNVLFDRTEFTVECDEEPVVTFPVNSSNFDGTKYYTLDSTLDPALDFVVSTWVVYDAVGNHNLFNKMNITSIANRAVVIRIYSTNQINVILYDNSGNAVCNFLTSTVLSSGTKYHLAFRKIGLSIEVYINGVLESSNVLSGVSNTSTKPWVLGHWASVVGEQLDGTMFEPRFYDDATLIDASAILEEYNGGTPMCFDLQVAQNADFDTASVLAVPLGNWNGNTGSEETDQSSAGVTLTPSSAFVFDRTEFTVECDS